MSLRKQVLSAAGSLALLGIVPAAQGIDLQSGDWTFSATGSINANYVYTACDNQSEPPNFGGTVAGSVVGACNINGTVGDNDVSGIRTGLLPGQLVFTAATQQNGWDISGTFGLYPGIVTNDDLNDASGSPNLTPGGNVGLGTTQLDFRQVFLKFGNSDFGTVKAGRDFGLFGFDAIINDMTIPAVGVSSVAVGSPGNTTLGSIGFGYIYADTLSQINYTTPDYGGFTLTAGIIQTIDSLTAGSTLGVGETAPGFQTQLKYTYEGGFVSLDAVTLEVDGVDTDPGDGTNFDKKRVSGVDLNWKQSFGPLDLLLSGYYTHGIGSVAYLFDSFDGAGNIRDSYGGLAQATYTVGKNKLGVNYGESRLDDTGYDADTLPATCPNTNNCLFKVNRKVTAGYYYSLTPNLTLTAEYSHAISENHANENIDADNVNVGAFFTF